MSLGASHTGEMLGTPRYISPEAIAGKAKLTGAADQYALAIVVYEHLSEGKLPFQASAAAHLLAAHLHTEPKPLNEVEPAWGKAVSLVLAKALSKNPANRFPNCSGFAELLLEAIESKDVDTISMSLASIPTPPDIDREAWIDALQENPTPRDAEDSTTIALDAIKPDEHPTTPLEVVQPQPRRKLLVSTLVCLAICGLLVSIIALQRGANDDLSLISATTTEGTTAELVKRAKRGDVEAQMELAKGFATEDSGMYDLEKAREWFLMAAGNGNIDAMGWLGLAYLTGNGAEMDPEMALSYLTQAAESGNAKAQNNLALLYKNGGGGIERDLAKARSWFIKAAEQGEPIAHVNLGNMWLHGQGGPQSFEEARKYFEIAAEYDIPEAFHNLGMLYQTGKGVGQDDAKALEYYTCGAELGDPSAFKAIGNFYFFGRAVGKDWKKAEENLFRAAQNNIAHSQYLLARIYEEGGDGVAKDIPKACEWFAKSAKNGYAAAAARLGYYYHNGIGVEKDDPKAYELFSMAAQKGNADAIRWLGLFHSQGWVVEEDDVKAFEYFQRAVELGNVFAMCDVGQAYRLGNGVLQDDQKAFKWYAKAAKQENARALHQLGRFYRDGTGVSQNFGKARDAFIRAVDAPDTSEYALARRCAAHRMKDAYTKGTLGVKKNSQEAKKWQIRAAQYGCPYCMYTVMYSYRGGKIFPKELQAGFELIRQAAEEGDCGCPMILDLAEPSQDRGISDGENAANGDSAAVHEC